MLDRARIIDYAEGVLTLLFKRQPVAAFFQNNYAVNFEMLASKIFGMEIKVKSEWEE